MPRQHACQPVRVVPQLITMHLFAHVIVMGPYKQQHLSISWVSGGLDELLCTRIALSLYTVDHTCKLATCRRVFVRRIHHNKDLLNIVIRCVFWQSASGTSDSEHVWAALAGLSPGMIVSVCAHFSTAPMYTDVILPSASGAIPIQNVPINSAL